MKIKTPRRISENIVIPIKSLGVSYVEIQITP